MIRFPFAIIFLLLGFRLAGQNAEGNSMDCLIGTGLNNPLLSKLIEEDNQMLKKFSLAENACKIKIWEDKVIEINNGFVDSIFSNYSSWERINFPESWGILFDYKKMWKTGDIFPKPPKDGSGANVTIEKDMGDFRIKVTYFYHNVPNGESTKRMLVPCSYTISAEKAFNNCGQKPPPQVYREILGNDGSSLPHWICDHFGKEVPESYLKENFVTVNMVEDYREAPDFSEGGYYAYHPIFRGDYYLSLDASILLRIEDGVLNGIGIYPQIMDSPVLPGIDRNTTRNNMKETYGKQDLDYMTDFKEYFLRTPSLECMFHFGHQDLLEFVWINQVYSCKPLVYENEFPLKDVKHGRCLSGDCENGTGTMILPGGRTSTGNFYMGNPYDIHTQTIRYGVEKREYYPGLENIKDKILSPEQKEILKGLSIPSHFYKDIDSAGFIFDREFSIKLRNGDSRSIPYLAKEYHLYLFVVVSESETVVTLNADIDKYTSGDVWEIDDNIAVSQTNAVFDEDKSGFINISVSGPENSDHEYMIKVSCYSRYNF